MCVCVCVCVCVYVCMYVFMYVCMYVCMYSRNELSQISHTRPFSLQKACFRRVQKSLFSREGSSFTSLIVISFMHVNKSLRVCIIKQNISMLISKICVPSGVLQ